MNVTPPPEGGLPAEDSRLQHARARRSDWGAALNRIGALQQKACESLTIELTPEEQATLEGALCAYADRVRRQIELADAEVARLVKMEEAR